MTGASQSGPGQVLSLDDPRWGELRTRNGNGAWVPAWLRELDGSADVAPFSERWDELCSEGTAWSAAYAAMPHLVRLAARVPPADRLELATVFGLIVMGQEPDDPDASVPADLRPGFERAVAEALPLVAEVLGVPQDDERDLRYVLMAVSALTGHTLLAECLDTLEHDDVCPPYAESLNA